MVGYNERKFSVLEYLVEEGSCTSEDLSRELAFEIHAARMSLLRYHRQQLLHRRTVPGGREKLYTLTSKGLERYYFLLEQP